MMDIYSPKGLETLEQERRAAELIERSFPKYKYIGTHKPEENESQNDAAAASVDAVLVENGKIKCVCETKCRVMTREKLVADYDNRWLVTFDKVMNARIAAFHLGVPMVGILYLVPDDIVLMQRICDAPMNRELGRLCTSMVIETTVTQKTVNGGKALRTNAYIDMSGATECKN